MIDDRSINEQLKFALTESNFDFLGPCYQGKVRDSYVRGDKRILIVSDRLSCFDVVITAVPFKGQVLNQLAADWFERSKHIVNNHVIDMPDENVMIVRQCEIIPVEVVVRGYLAGSALRDYQAGNLISGLRFPDGLMPHAKLPEPVLTPSTKAKKGDHDLPISEQDLLAQGIVEAKIWSEVREKALALFALGSKRAEERGLLLVDTKYEFGLCQGKVTLADEIHTLDCSRYWVKDSYSGLMSSGGSPEMLDKEPIRQWLLSQGYKGDGPIPIFTDQHRVSIAKHYISAFERISGLEFVGQVGDVSQRIEARLRNLHDKGFF